MASTNSYHLNDFHYALSLLNTFYGIDIEPEDFEEIALMGFNLIGNKRTRLYRKIYKLDGCDKEVELPCNLVEIEAVTIGNIEEWAHSTNDTPDGDFNSLYIEHYIEHHKSFRHPMYLPGKYVKYEQVGNKLYFDRPHGLVFLLYKGEVVDDDGLPQITDKEARALATYCAWVIKYKDSISNPQSKYSMLAVNNLLQQWNIQCDLARVDRYMSQNEWDQVLDAKNSWNRKMYGRSLKVYQ